MECSKCKAPVKYLQGVGLAPPLLYDDKAEKRVLKLEKFIEAAAQEDADGCYGMVQDFIEKEL